MTAELKVPGIPGTLHALSLSKEWRLCRENLCPVAVVFLELRDTKWYTLCMLVISQCGKMCGYELNLVNTFSVMLGWVELALIKKWLCLLVLCKLFRSRSDPNKTSDLCFPL